MKVLVVYYSRTGTTKAIAEKISKSLNCEIEEIFDEKNRAGPLGWLGGGKDASQKNLTKIKPVKNNPQNFDFVIFGSPIWAGNVTPAIRTYISENKIKLKNVAFFCTMGGNNSSQFFKDAQDICQKRPKAILAVNASEAKTNKTDDLIGEFVKKLK